MATKDSYELWIERGQCSENIWLFCILLFLMPYVYYKLGKEKKGIALLILGLLISLISLKLTGFYSVGIAFFAYAIFDTYLIASRYNEDHKVTNNLDFDVA
jgi:membrane-bound ClpP family serine protease